MGCRFLPRNLPDPGIESVSRMFPALAGDFFTTSTTWEAHLIKKYGGVGVGEALGT